MKKKKNPSIKVMFVGGYGRSGSTLIDLLISRSSGVVAVGEFRHIFGRALGDNELCSCSQPFRDCPFWTKVLNHAFPDGYDREQIHSAVRAYNKLAVLPLILFPILQTKKKRLQASIYADAFSRLYRSINILTGSEVIIDSTKYPLHGLFIKRMILGLDMRTMLLVRDPRAVAFSWQRRKLRPEVHWEKREMPRHS